MRSFGGLHGTYGDVLCDPAPSHRKDVGSRRICTWVANDHRISRKKMHIQRSKLENPKPGSGIRISGSSTVDLALNKRTPGYAAGSSTCSRMTVPREDASDGRTLRCKTAGLVWPPREGSGGNYGIVPTTRRQSKRCLADTMGHHVSVGSSPPSKWANPGARAPDDRLHGVPAVAGIIIFAAAWTCRAATNPDGTTRAAARCAVKVTQGEHAAATIGWVGSRRQPGHPRIQASTTRTPTRAPSAGASAPATRAVRVTSGAASGATVTRVAAP